VVKRPEQWDKIKEIVGAALEKEVSQRPAFLDGACAQDNALRAEVESLVAAYEESDRLPENPWISQSAIAEEFNIIGPYKLLRKLGEGGMGQVWLADQTAPVRRRVALKLIRAGIYDQSVLHRFQSEQQSLAMMEHPAIAKVFDAGATPAGQPYFAMEYVEGFPITIYCDQKRLSIRERLELFVRVCEGVQHAHQKAILHRDLKPANILVVEQDGKPMPRIIDFGLAKATAPAAEMEAFFTQVGAFLGTPGYMSPEQADPAILDVDTRTDVFSLGVVLYELLTGALPSDVASWKKLRLDEVLRKLRDEDPPRPSTKVTADRETAASRALARRTVPTQLAGLLRGDLDWIALKAVEKERERRYATPSELAADITCHLQNRPIAARPASAAYRVHKFVRRNRAVVALASLVGAASIAGVIGTLVQARTARVQRDFAFRQLSRAEAINDLNSFLLSDAAPSGQPFTVNDLLKRAEHVVEHQRGNDVTRVELLMSIGRQYTVQDEYAKARLLLEEAHTLSRSLAERSTRSRASCALAQTLSRGDDLPRGEALYSEGMAELSDEPMFIVDRVFCLERGSEVAENRGDAREGIARAQAARRLLKQSPFQSELLELDTMIILAGAYSYAGQHQDAIAAFEQAAARMTELGRDDTQRAGTLFNNWGLELTVAGRPFEAEKVLRRSVAISEDNRGEETVSPMVLINYSRTLRDLERLDEAADYAERGYVKAQQAGDAMAMGQVLFLRASIYRAKGDLKRSAKMLSEVEPRLRRLPAGHIAWGVLASHQSLDAEARGDTAAALELANKAVAIAESSSNVKGSYYLQNFLVGRSDIERELGRADQAAADAVRAITLVRQDAQLGAFSSHLGQAYLTLGRALQAQGKQDEARASFRSAAQNFESTQGAGSPDAYRARQLASMDSQPK
jgi:non-specific serine/threonine protein kinase/serine/threonine-protein kinase